MDDLTLPDQFDMFYNLAELMSSRIGGGMLSVLTSRVRDFALLRHNGSYRVALEGTNHTVWHTLGE
jgi:hypothetical protein